MRKTKIIDDEFNSNNSIQSIYKELNFPSSDKLKSVLRTRGISFNAKEIEKLTRNDSVRAVQGPTYKFNGKIAATDLDDRWFIDLIDFTASPSDGGKKIQILASTSTSKKYILVAQDVFSRKIWAEALPDKKPQTVAEGFRYILAKSKRKPKSILSDSGAEFQNEFEQLVKRTLGIEVQHKAPNDTNAIATLDNAIGQLKKAMARVMRQSLNDDWNDVLQKVVRGQNNIPNKEYLEGQTPESVEGNPQLREHLKEKNGEFSKINQTNATNRRGKLENAGGFLVPTVTDGPVHRGWKPNFDDKVHVIKEVTNNTVEDNRGNTYDTRFVNPTRALNSTANPPSAIERPGSVPIQNKQREALRVYADQLAEKIRELNGTMKMTAVHTHISDKPAFQDAAAKVRLNKASLYKNFVGLYPELFTLSGNELSIKRRLRPMIVPAAVQPPNRRRLRPMLDA